MAGRQRIDRVRRQYNQWVANQTLEDYALRFTAKRARRWSAARVANTALGAISFLALEAIGGTITLNYGVTNSAAAILVVSAIIFCCGLPIAYHAAKCGIDIDLLTRGAGFGYIGSTITSLIYASFTFIFFAIASFLLGMAYTMLPITDSAMLLLGFPLGIVVQGIFAGIGAYLTELYPNHIRGSGQGFCYNLGRGIGSFFPIAVGTLAQTGSLVKAIGMVAGGGYLLARSAEDTRISDAIMAVDEPIRATRCKPNSGTGCHSDKSRCLTHDLWEELSHQIHLFLNSVSLADVCEKRVLGRSGTVKTDGADNVITTPAPTNGSTPPMPESGTPVAAE